MHYLELWKLLNLALDIDWEKRRLTLRLGPLTIQDLPLATVRKLSENHQLVEDLLSEQFVRRGVMWADFRRERVADCINSLRDLQTKSLKNSEAFASSRKPEDGVVATVLQGWANSSDEAAKLLEFGLEDESDPANTGMDVSASDYIPDSLGKLRKDTFPIVQMFIDLLPDGNAVR